MARNPEVTINVVAKTAAAKAELSSLGSATKSLRDGLKAGVVGAAVVAGAGLAAMAAQGIAGARESAQIHRVLASQLKTMGGEARKAFGGATSFAEDYGKAIGKDDDDILKVINKLSTFPAAFKAGSLGAKGMERATKAAFDLEATGIGSAESNIVGIGKALDNPVKGMTALSKSGVSFTAQQKKQVEQYMKAGQLAKAQAVVLQGIESNAKGAAGAQADGLTRAKTALDGFAESVASKALPYLDRFGNWFTDKGLPKLEQFAAWFEANAVPKIGQAFTTAKNVAQGFVAVLSNPAVQAFGATILTVVAGLKIYSATMTVIKAVTTAWRTAQLLLNIALTANPIGIIVLAIAALAVGIYVAYKRSATFRAIVQAVGAAFVTAGAKVVAFVKTAIAWVKQVPDKIKGFFSNAKSLLLSAGSDVIQGFWNGLKGKFESAKKWLTDKIASLPAAAKKVLGIASPSRVFRWIAERIPEGFSVGLAKGWQKYGTGASKKLVAQMGKDLAAKAKTLVAARKQAVADLVAARTDYAKGIADNVRGGGATALANLDGAAATAGPDILRNALQARLKAIQTYRSDLTALAKRGIGRSLLTQLIDGGIDAGGALAASLRNASPAVLKQITALNAQVEKQANLTGVNLAGQVFNGRIATAQRAAAQPIVLRLDTDGSAWSKLMVAELRKAVRAAGGNVQLVLGARA